MLQSQRFQIGLTNFHPLRNELPRNRFMGSPFSQCKLFVETELEDSTVNDSLLSKRIASQQALSFGVPTVIFSTILVTATSADLDQIITNHQHSRPHIPTLRQRLIIIYIHNLGPWRSSRYRANGSKSKKKHGRNRAQNSQEK